VRTAFLPVLAAAVAAGCRPAPRPALLHELPEWQGTVVLAVRGEAAPAVQGEVVFHRARQVLQLTLRGERTTALARLPGGEVRAFVDGQPAAAGDAERARLELVHAVVTAPAGAAVREAAGGYELDLADGRTVTVRAERAQGGHGHR
jgi:hypothetical protein